MPKLPPPLALCLEDLAAPSEAERYLCCTAIPGRQSGLALSSAGVVTWQSEASVAAELWVTADGRLALYRREGAPGLRLLRSERSLEVPAEKPVIALEGDLLELAGRSYRIFVHGQATSVTAPYWFKSAVAAGLAVGVALGTAACQPATQRIEVRDQPPAVAPEKGPTPEPSASAAGSSAATPGTGAPLEPRVSPGAGTQPLTPPVEVRMQPPAPLPRPPKPPAPGGGGRPGPAQNP